MTSPPIDSPDAPQTSLPLSDFFEAHDGNAAQLPTEKARRAWWVARDLCYDLKVWWGGGLRRARSASAAKVARVLIVGIEVPSRASDIHDTVARLSRKSKHHITTSIVPMLDRGKFANIDVAIDTAAAPLKSFDWLVLTDDDIAFSPHLLDDLIAVASAADFALAQPAHAFMSHTTYHITRRCYGTLARRTNFVEIGPLTLVRADLFDSVVPSPPSRWCYGIDLLWSVAARRAGRRIGIIDASPVRHLRPVAGGYDMDAAWAEGKQLIRDHGVTDNRADLFGVNEVVLTA